MRYWENRQNSMWLKNPTRSRGRGRKRLRKERKGKGWKERPQRKVPSKTSASHQIDNLWNTVLHWRKTNRRFYRLIYKIYQDYYGSSIDVTITYIVLTHTSSGRWTRSARTPISRTAVVLPVAAHLCLQVSNINFLPDCNSLKSLMPLSLDMEIEN